jgi:Reverse transcriptase (RNA-dependent DNA polymerase)
MSPTQHKSRDFLFEEVTSRFALNAAWLHARPRLESSRDEKIRSETALFASNTQKSISQLQSSLRSGTFLFERQKGILKNRKMEPGGPIPQGSALSALCANIVLSEFDSEFNKRGVTTIRYLDDFVMLAKDKRSAEAAFKSAESLLAKNGFDCHDPFASNSAKASTGQVSEGFDFLSFRISSRSISPTRAARSEFLQDIVSAIGSAKVEIQCVDESARRAEPKFAQALVRLDRKIRGWGDAFKPTTDRIIFAQLDEKIGKEIDQFQSWFRNRVTNQNHRVQRRSLGVALLLDTPRAS